MLVMDDVTNFWLFTILFAFVGFFLSRFLCNLSCYHSTIGERRYFLFQDKEMLPIIKIENQNA